MFKNVYCLKLITFILEEQCQICLSPYQMNDKALCMPCDHIFHENCLKIWLEKV